jgi:hypothetical protein
MGEERVQREEWWLASNANGCQKDEDQASSPILAALVDGKSGCDGDNLN